MNPDPVTFGLHPTQCAVWEGTARFRVVSAGRRWGKTRLAAVRLVTQAIGSQQGFGRYWYVAPTRVMAKDILWHELKQLAHPWLASPPLETELSLSFHSGASIRLMGAEDPDSLRGRGLAGVILDEYADMAEATWTEALLPSLADTGGWAWFIGTPKSFNHFYTLFVTAQTAADWQAWQFRTLDNPFIRPAEIEAARREMDARTYRQEFEASFEAMSGRVYYAFSRTAHVGPVTLDVGAPAVVACDFNVDPCTCVIGQKLGDELRIWREVRVRHAGGEATRAMATRARDLLREVGWRGSVELYGDPAGKAAKTTGPSDHAVLRECFPGAAWCIPGRPPHVRDRIAAVNGRLETLDGRQHTRIDPTCVGLIADLEQVTFDETGQIDKRSNPALTHLSDALGYFVERRWRRLDQLGFGSAYIEGV